jgi:hypothetical protein
MKKQSLTLLIIASIFLLNGNSFAQDPTPDNWVDNSGTGNITTTWNPEIRNGGFLMLRPTANDFAYTLKAFGYRLGVYSGLDPEIPILTFAHNNAVGIGITDPDKPLHIYKSLSGTGSDDITLLKLHNPYNAQTNNAYGVGIAFQLSTDYPEYKKAEIRAVNSGGWANDIDLTFWSGGSTTDDHQERMRIKSNGNVGIGTTTPKESLHIQNGDIAIGVLDSSYGDPMLKFYHGPDNYYASIYREAHSGKLFIKNDQGNPIILDNGNVGIGTYDPGIYKLAVNGIIRAKEVKVETNWSDFVFEDNYTLPTLDKVESYIKENKHLPDIPSAKEVEEEGLSMSQMMAKQMQKIEELTLYVIEQNKQLSELKNENAEMKQKLEKLVN